MTKQPSKVKRMQRKRTKGWRMPPNTVYVGRPSKWGNPYKNARAGGDGEPMSLEWILWRYKKDCRKHYFRKQIKAELKGKNLACWCPLDQLCHADILLEIANL